jgi:hypothetical protein
MLDREEYVEQAYFYRTLRERVEQGGATQEQLQLIRHELLATTRLPMAIDYMITELKHSGSIGPAMQNLKHYFTPFQAYLVHESEEETGRFDFFTALRVLEHEAEYRANSPDVQGLFFYQFETLCRNRLKYDSGIAAMAGDPIYDEGWRAWLGILRHQIGLVDFADLVYVRSSHYNRKPGEEDIPTLFGEREGKIAFANHKKDPLHLFSALQRHLDYPTVPRQHRVDEPEALVPLLVTRIEQLEAKVDLLQEELRGGINLSKYYVGDDRGKKS